MYKPKYKHYSSVLIIKCITNTLLDIATYTIPKYPNTDLLELAEIVVLIIPNSGIIEM